MPIWCLPVSGRKSSRGGLTDDEVLTTVARDVGEITKVAERGVMLTQQLLTFSRRTMVRPEVLGLNSVINEMESLLRTTIGESIHLRLELAIDLPLIKADRGQMDQVFMNLVVNARDAMIGGGNLEIRTATLIVDEHLASLYGVKAGTYARLTVSDTGTGMSQEVVERSFEPFFTTKDKGTGFGLATVYGIVTQAGGNILIDSHLGSGTTVRIDLPATFDPLSPRTDSKPDFQRAAHGETVLLVEDEEFVREPVRRILMKYGYAVLTAATADAAMSIVHGHLAKIDLLLTDVVMPGLSGKDLAFQVLTHRPTTRVLFMSGYSSDVIAPRGVLDDGVNLIEKPFSSDDLLRKVREVLHRDSTAGV